MNNLNPKRDEDSEAKIRFRCPCCSKLYVSSADSIYVEKPEFKCTSCDTNFYISLTHALNATEVVGYEVSAREPEVEEVREPLSKVEDSVEEAVAKKTQEFKASDIDWAIVEESLDFKEQPEEKEELEEAWSSVLAHYNKSESHKDFIDLSKRSEKVDFAKSKYEELLKANPFDEVARTALNKMEIEEQTELILAQKDDKAYMTTRFWSSVIVGLGLTLIVLGLFIVPQYQKVAGLGFGLVVFTFALKSLFQKSPAPY